jgi:signal transduction histidine kinase/CheY-like chemotaxis protein
MAPPPDEEDALLRAVATENAHAIEAARRRAERELRAAKDALEDQAQALTLALGEVQKAHRAAELESRAKDEFLAMLSHELRNPLGVIASAARLLEDVAQATPTAARAHAVIARQVDHLRRLVDDLLDVGRVTTGKIDLSRRPLDVAALVDGLMAAWRVSGRFAEHAVTVATDPVWIDADETRLEQIVSNLVVNALKFTPAGGAVAVRVSPDGGEAVLEVEDRGAGISSALQGRVFDLFVQGEPGPDRAQGGLGIGLTMVRSLVKLHGGTVRAFSDGPGRGTEVVVKLPRVLGAARTPRPAAGFTVAKTERSLRVLVVDDNVDAARTLGELLRYLGHQVAVASDGPSALAAAATVAPELVLIDIGLPGMDGYALASALRSAGHGLAALIAVTGYGRDEDLRRSSEAGFDHHLVKPVDLAALQRITLARARAPAPPTRS